VPSAGLTRALRDGIRALGIEDPGSERLDALLNFLEQVQRWNRAFNLTAVRDLRDMVTRHLLDSLSVLPHIQGQALLDAGSGAGLPGIPLAIMEPGWCVTLLDSSGKKVRFLRHVQRELQLENIRTVQARLESWAAEERFDAIICRAFSDLGSFVRAARHLAQPQTRLYAMKGRCPRSELEALPSWVTVGSVEKLSVPGLQEERHLVIMSVIP
jgi:16S rRNA (guanine527-N7)-methyltransferase